MSMKDRIPTWPVAADILFERVRSTEYMALATAISLTEWLVWLIIHSRSVLANRPWDSWNEEDTNPPIAVFWAVYADCAGDPNSTSAWSAGKPCGDKVSAGYIWEPFFSTVQFVMYMVILQTVNNPWRSKWVWFLPALSLIVYSIYDYGRVAFTRPSWADAYGDEADMAVFFNQAFFFVFFAAWSVLCVLLVSVLFVQNDMEKKQQHSWEWTRSLLHLRGVGAKTPTNFQTLAGALRPVCSLEHLPAVANAALVAQKSCEEPPRSRSGPGLLASLRGLKAQVTATLVGVKVAPADPPNDDLDSQVIAATGDTARPGEPTDQDNVEPTKQTPPAAPASSGNTAGTARGPSSNKEQAEACGAPLGAGERHRRPASLQRLPALAQASIGMSLLFVLVPAVYVAFTVLNVKLGLQLTGLGIQEIAKDTVLAGEGALSMTQAMRTGSAEAIAQLSSLNDTLGEVAQQADNVSLGIETAMSKLLAVNVSNAESALALQEALDALQALQASGLQARQLSLGGSTASAALGLGVDAASGVLTSVSGILLTLDGGLAELEGQLVILMETLKSLLEWVDWGTEFALELSKSVESTGIAGLCISLVAVFGVVAFTAIGWKKQLAQLRSGEIRKSQHWKPNAFHPIKSAMLPGVMASTNLFMFLILWLVLFLVMEVLWMLFYNGFTIPWDFIGTLASTTGVGLIFKKLLLDKLATKLLTKNGFVTRWASFAWFVLLTMPFYSLLGILASVFRFIFVAGAAFFYMGAVHVTILPPSVATFFDSAWVNSWSMLVTSHRHNGPINHAFGRTLMREGGGHELKRTRAQKNWKLAVTLARNPALIQSRVNDPVEESTRSGGAAAAEGPPEPTGPSAESQIQSSAVDPPEEPTPSQGCVEDPVEEPGRINLG